VREGRKQHEHVTLVIDGLDENGREDREPQIQFENRLILAAFLYGLDGIAKNVTEIEYLVRPFTVADSRIYVVNEPVLGKEKAFVFDREGDSLPQLERCVLAWLGSFLPEKARETVSLIDGNLPNCEPPVSFPITPLEQCQVSARKAGRTVDEMHGCKWDDLHCPGCPYEDVLDGQKLETG